uniref:Uncharacterized protein n=1 Tax=Rhipicephalus pulchellus TaxID=72859 RepID=L7M140_RHIPC
MFRYVFFFYFFFFIFFSLCVSFSYCLSYPLFPFCLHFSLAFSFFLFFILSIYHLFPSLSDSLCLSVVISLYCCLSRSFYAMLYSLPSFLASVTPSRLSSSLSLPFPTPLLHKATVCPLACLGTRVVSALAYGLRVRVLKSCLVKNIFRQGVPLSVPFCLFLCLFIYLFLSLFFFISLCTRFLIHQGYSKACERNPWTCFGSQV